MKINISGPLSRLIKDLPDIELDKLIGLPIMNDECDQIGIITEIDVANDMWWGVADCNNDIEFCGLAKTCSCEIVKEG